MTEISSRVLCLISVRAKTPQLFFYFVPAELFVDKQSTFFETIKTHRHLWQHRFWKNHAGRKVSQTLWMDSLV